MPLWLAFGRTVANGSLKGPFCPLLPVDPAPQSSSISHSLAPLSAPLATSTAPSQPLLAATAPAHGQAVADRHRGYREP